MSLTPTEKTDPVPVSVQMDGPNIIWHYRADLKVGEEGEIPYERRKEIEKAGTFFQSLIWRLATWGQSFEAKFTNTDHQEEYEVILNLPFQNFR